MDTTHIFIDKNDTLAIMLDALDICVQAVDAKGNIIFFSRRAEQLEHLRREDILGKNLTEVYKDELDAKVNSRTSALLRVLAEKKPCIGSYMPYYAGKRRVSIITDAYPVFREGELIGAIAMFRDVARAKKMSLDILDLERSLLLKKQHAEGELFSLNDIIFRSENMQEALKIARRASANEMPVLIAGETGTGKEMFAQGIHNQSSVSGGPFISVNGAAIPDTLMESLLFGTSRGAFTGAIKKAGLLEQAENGSLFLDEINAMPLHLQSKLLRALQTRRFMRVGGDREYSFNARIISAVGGDPATAIRNHQLREDIYYRLAVISLTIPPLRERRACLPALTAHFLQKYCEPLGKHITTISDEVRSVFSSYSWFGNVRELEHVLAYGVALAEYDAECIELDDLPPYLKASVRLPSPPTPAPTGGEPRSLHDYLENCERDYLQKIRDDYQGNITHMASALGLSRQNLQYRLKKLSLK